MERTRLHMAYRISFSFLFIAALTLFFSRVATNVNTTTVALSFLLAILAIATTWGMLEAILSAIVAMGCFNFFFLPPVGTLTIADPQNWVALFAFLVTAIVASQLSAGIKKRAREATERQQEMERLYGLSRSLMLLEKNSATAEQVSQRIA